MVFILNGYNLGFSGHPMVQCWSRHGLTLHHGMANSGGDRPIGATTAAVVDARQVGLLIKPLLDLIGLQPDWVDTRE